MKICSVCKKEKELSEFHRCSAIKSGYRSSCKECRKESEKSYSKEYLLRPGMKEKKAAYRVENSLRDKETRRLWREKNLESARQSSREWIKNNPEKAVASCAKRRATRKQATPIWGNPFFIEEIYALAKLKEKLLGGKWEVDHIVPLTSDIVCGLHWEKNLMVVRRENNRSKHNRYWPDMPQRLGLTVIG